MRERDLRRVKREAMEIVRRAIVTIDGARAVCHVTDEWMREVPEVTAA